MAGTLTISTLSDGTNSTSSTNCIQGSAKAWVSFSVSGGVCTRLSSYNVSSVTYNSTGNYTVNFTNALTDANYCPVISGFRNSNTTDATYVGFTNGSLATSSNFRIFTATTSGAVLDFNTVYASVFR